MSESVVFGEVGILVVDCLVNFQSSVQEQRLGSLTNSFDVAFLSSL
jgi:hypothetical protein